MSLNNWTNKNIIVENTSSYMADQDFDIVEEARGKKIVDPLRAKLMGMEDIRDLKGTMTPRYFATKVIRYLQKENPELDLENLSDDDIQNAINIMANVSKPLASRPDVKITTRERGAAKEGLKKGDSGFETLQLNLGGDTILNSEGGVGENDLYTVVSDGLKYRVTLNSFKGQKLNLDDISKDDIVSVVIVKPSETEKVDKFGGEIEMGDREKLVADFPEGESVPAEDNLLAVMAAKKAADALTGKGNSEDNEMSNATGAVGYMSRQDSFGSPPEDAESCSMSDEEFDKEKSDLDDDGEVSEYEKSRGVAIANAMKKEQERAGQSHARAVADHYEDENDHQKEIEDERKAQDRERQQEIEAEIRASRGEEDAERCPVTGKLRKKKSESEEEEQELAMSPQAINQAMIERGRQEIHRQHQIERMFRHGY